MDRVLNQSNIDLLLIIKGRSYLRWKTTIYQRASTEELPRSPDHVRFNLVCANSCKVVVAEKMSGSKMYELVKVGWDKLVGEIIKLEGDTASI
jgi:hypothetical protein